MSQMCGDTGLLPVWDTIGHIRRCSCTAQQKTTKPLPDRAAVTAGRDRAGQGNTSAAVAPDLWTRGATLDALHASAWLPDLEKALRAETLLAMLRLYLGAMPS